MKTKEFADEHPETVKRLNDFLLTAGKGGSEVILLKDSIGRKIADLSVEVVASEIRNSVNEAVDPDELEMFIQKSVIDKEFVSFQNFKAVLTFSFRAGLHNLLAREGESQEPFITGFLFSIGKSVRSFYKNADSQEKKQEVLKIAEKVLSGLCEEFKDKKALFLQMILRATFQNRAGWLDFLDSYVFENRRPAKPLDSF